MSGKHSGLKVLRTPLQATKANAYCERLMGTSGVSAWTYVIPLSEKHLRTILREWVATTIREDHTPAWDQAFPIFVGDQYGDRKLKGMSCRPLAGSEPRIFLVGCTTNIGWKKLPPEVG